MSTLLLVPSKDLSCKIFREYPAAIKKAEQFLLEVNCEGTLQEVTKYLKGVIECIR